MTTNWANAFILAAAFLIAPITTTVIVPIAKTFETRFFPVVSKLDIIPRKDKASNTLTFDVSGHKKRNCTFVGVEVLVYKEEVWQRGDVTFLSEKRDSIPHSRPTGKQHFGTWAVVPDGDQIRLIAKHDCHALWRTTTELGTFIAS